MLSTAMPFLDLDRDLVVAEVMRRRNWRIAGIVGGWHPTSRSTRPQKGRSFELSCSRTDREYDLALDVPFGGSFVCLASVPERIGAVQDDADCPVIE